MKKFGNASASLGILLDGNLDYLGLGTGMNIPDEDTVHLISSMAKPILAVGLGISAVSSGKFGLDTPVEDILPLCAACNHRNGAPLRVVDLLDHRSEFFRCDRLWEGPKGSIGIQDKCTILKLLQHLPLNRKYNHEPAFHYTRNYSNIGYAILAMIIETTTGESWAEFVHDKIFRPLGMTRSTADMSCRGPDTNIADAYCSLIEGQELLDMLGEDENLAATHERFVTRVMNSDQITVAQPVQPSKCSDTATYIGAAAGIRSTVSDLLKFYEVCIALSTNKPNRKLTEFEAGAITVMDHINCCAQDPTCAYTGGWNPVNLPWDQKQRAPGADGENYGRLQDIAGLGIAELRQKEQFWPFFHGDRNQSQQLAWFHGGNMVGATSSVFVIPNMRLAVVVLCDSRSFFIDAANMMAIMLADSLYSGRTVESVMGQLEKISLLSEHCAARYMVEVGRYERALLIDYERGFASAHRYRQCMGRYSLVEGICLEILPDNTGTHLELHYNDFQYPLRVKRGSTSDKLTMSYAMPMKELHENGLGGKHWLSHKPFEISFLGTSGGSYRHLVWTFENFGGEMAFEKVTGFDGI